MKFKAKIEFEIETDDMEKCGEDIDTMLADLGNMYSMWNEYRELWEIKDKD